MKLTDEEVEELNKLTKQGYKWIARDKNDLLYSYKRKPIKCLYLYTQKWINGGLLKEINKILFQFINQEDEEPQKIEELLNS